MLMGKTTQNINGVEKLRVYLGSVLNHTFLKVLLFVPLSCRSTTLEQGLGLGT